MNFLNPQFIHAAWLSLIPIAIHFWNKKKLDSRMWGTLRFFPDSSTATKQTIHLHHIWLLILRLLMLFLAIFWLMHPVLERNLILDETKLVTIQRISDIEKLIADSSSTFPKLAVQELPPYLPNLPIDVVKQEVQSSAMIFSSELPSTLKKVLSYVDSNSEEVQNENTKNTIHTDTKSIILNGYDVKLENKSQTVRSHLEALFALDVSWKSEPYSGRVLWQNEGGESIVWSRADTLFVPSVFLDEAWIKAHPLVVFHVVKLIQSELHETNKLIVESGETAFVAPSKKESKRPSVMLLFIIILGIERILSARGDV